MSIYRKSIGNRSNLYRTSIEHISTCAVAVVAASGTAMSHDSRRPYNGGIHRGCCYCLPLSRRESRSEINHHPSSTIQVSGIAHIVYYASVSCRISIGHIPIGYRTSIDHLSTIYWRSTTRGLLVSRRESRSEINLIVPPSPITYKTN